MKDPYWSLWGKLKSYERKTVEIDSVYDREFRVADEFAGALADGLGTLTLLKRKLEVVLSAGQIFVAGCKIKTVNGDQHAVNYLRKIDTDDSYYRLMAIDIPSEGAVKP